MKATMFIDDPQGSSVGFKCLKCGDALDEVGTQLYHSTQTVVKVGTFSDKMGMSTCQHAGKYFKNPLCVELQEEKRED